MQCANGVHVTLRQRHPENAVWPQTSEQYVHVMRRRLLHFTSNVNSRCRKQCGCSKQGGCSKQCASGLQVARWLSQWLSCGLRQTRLMMVCRVRLDRMGGLLYLVPLCFMAMAYALTHSCAVKCPGPMNGHPGILTPMIALIMLMSIGTVSGSHRAL